MKVRFLGAARRELTSAVAFFEAERPGLGKRFLDAANAATSRLAVFPRAGAPADGSFRRIRVRDFPYCVFYVVEPGELLIVAVAHDHREPDYWRNRR